ncbi:Bifunctional dihydrofolate reductase-thymidylate synthase [Coccomyxa sp. Obi]|nr:Bifunctional dihydrofolate reductase-thymidylate synthase [Coccomyxa sp. Obi]
MAAAAEQMTFQIVVAATKKLGIGKGGTMPWKLPGDMAYFKELTTRTADPSKQNAVVMGRKTWESIPPKFRPLPGRVNVVLSRGSAGDENQSPHSNSRTDSLQTATSFKGAHLTSSLDSAMALLDGSSFRERIETVFVIGGGQVYEEALPSPLCSAVHFTAIESEVDCDTFFPEMRQDKWRLWSSSAPRRDKDMRYSFQCYVPASATSSSTAPSLPPALAAQHEELQYLDLVDDVIRNGVFRGDRTGTGTFAKFGCQMRFNLRHTFPLLTTKRTFWRGVVEELLWFISGSTNANVLKAKGVGIWDGNGSREYLDSIGLTHREEGDLGPVYGFQWRHFGAEYTDMHADYSGKGVDQLAQLIEGIRAKPHDRRHVLTAWNPAALPDMALPPCHLFCQFFVAEGELSCQMYQRSCDLGLGVPFNIASYALLTRLIAQVCGLRAGELVHVLGDAHVYANHVEPLKEQLQNAPRPFPVLRINPEKMDIDNFAFEDFELLGYEPHKKIAMKIAV